jgi:ATPase subunit of ABC transporter with duplicated ATPase domains
MRKGYFMFYAIVANDISFELPDGRELLTNLNFSIDNRLTALVGPNGIGKTTLAKLISGELTPSGGNIQRNVSISFFSQREIPMNIPVYEYLLNDYTWSSYGEQLLEGINRESLCSSLSGGQWMRVRLARALDDQFLILDEPTNDLDREGRGLVLNFLRQRTGGGLLISHDRECLGVCKEILELSNRGLSKYGGNYSDYALARENERSHLQENLKQAKKERESMLSKQQEQREKQEKRNSRGTQAAKKGGLPRILIGGRKSKAQVTTAKLEVGALEKVNEAVRETYEALNQLKIDPVMYTDLVGKKIPTQKLVAEATKFNIKYQNWIYKNDLNFCWRGNIRIALKGANGSGKSSLLKAIMKEKLDTRGDLKIGDLRTLYIDQRCSILNDKKTIFENVRSYSSLGDSEIRNGLAKFLFSNDSVFQKVESLSGGERLRVALACGLLSNEKPELLILDEPTNNLDLVNIEFLEDLIRQFEGALIAISHDNVFLENCEIFEEILISD